MKKVKENYSNYTMPISGLLVLFLVTNAHRPRVWTVGLAYSCRCPFHRRR